MNPGDGLEPLDARVATEDENDEAPPSPHRRRGRVALWCALTAVVVAAVAVVALRNPARTPEEDLAQVRDFVAGAATGHFQGTSRSEYGSGGDEPGSTSIDVSRVEGSFVIPDRVHAVDDSGGYVTETISVEDGAYYREASSRGDLDEEPWVYYETDGEGRAWATTGPSTVFGVSPAGMAGATGVLGALGAPFDLGELFDRLEDDVRRVSPGVLEASMPLRNLLPAEVIAQMEQFAAEYKAEFEENTADLEVVADAAELDLDDQFSTDFLDDPITTAWRMRRTAGSTS